MSEVKTAAIVGGGIIGGGWAARLIECGIDVVVFDPAPDAQAKFDAVLANAEQAYARLSDAPSGRCSIILRYSGSFGFSIALT